MNVRILPGPWSGKVDPVISSKSQGHRALICAALTGDAVRIRNVSGSEDIRATAGCLRALGCDLREENGGIDIRPGRRTAEDGTVAALDCGESGSSLRFLLPVAAALGVEAAFTGRGKLAQRPLSPLYEQMAAHGARLSPQGAFPLRASGRLTPGVYTLAGNVSSQFISGLLMALPLLAGDSEIRIAGKMESGPYVDMTLEMLGRFGVRAERTEDGFRVPGGQRYRSPGEITVEGDWSGAAFFLAAGAFSEAGVTCAPLNLRSSQGDRRILALLRGFGAIVEEKDGEARVRRGTLKGMEIDIADIPDLAPVLAAVAAHAEGETRLTHIARLRLKESDRVESVIRMIRGLGGQAEAGADEMRIRGGALAGGTVDSFGDHRIAMAAAVAAIAAKGPVTIIGAEAVNKSYPGFWEEREKLCALREST